MDVDRAELGVPVVAGPVDGEAVRTGLPYYEAPYWALPAAERRRRIIAGAVGLCMGAVLGGLVVALWMM